MSTVEVFGCQWLQKSQIMAKYALECLVICVITPVASLITNIFCAKFIRDERYCVSKEFFQFSGILKYIEAGTYICVNC
jgi:hypothetical protein